MLKLLDHSYKLSWLLSKSITKDSEKTDTLFTITLKNELTTCFNDKRLGFKCFYISLRCTSGLDKNLDQWVVHPLLFNLMSISLHISNMKLQKMQSLVKRPNICLTYFKEKLLVSNTYCILGKLPRFIIQLVYIN